METIKFDNYSKPSSLAQFNIVVMLTGFILIFAIDIAPGLTILLFGFALSTMGKRTLYHFKTNEIIKTNLFLFFPVGKRTVVPATNFDVAHLFYYSKTETLHRQSLFHVWGERHVSKTREYRVKLLSSKSRDSLSVGYFQDYKDARALLLRFKQEWNYQLDDKVMQKMKKNKEFQKNSRRR